MVFKDPFRKINDNYLKLDTYIKALGNIIEVKQEKYRTQYTKIIAKLDTLSPLKTLYRGYSITEKNNKIIKSKNELNKGDLVDIIFSDGKKQAKVMEEERN